MQLETTRPLCAWGNQTAESSESEMSVWRKGKEKKIAKSPANPD